MNTNKTFASRAGDIVKKNNVTILFIVLCILSFMASTYSLPSLFAELFTRIGRNTFMVLSLLIPVMAGLGLNFGIVIGAIAAQIAIFFVVHLGFTGITGLLLCVLFCTPLAILFGYLVGRLFNSMKGTEMIGGLVAGYFSDGLYQFFFLVILGGVIPINNPTLMISTGVGVKNVINLKDNLKYALDDLPMLTIIETAFYVVLAVSAIAIIYRLVKKQPLGLKKILFVFIPVAILFAASFIPAGYAYFSRNRLPLIDALTLGLALVALFSLYRIIRALLIDKKPGIPIRPILYCIAAIVIYVLTFIPGLEAALMNVNLPVATYLCILALCVFISWFTNTKLGQDMRTVGQSREVATSSGINVDRTRIIAMVMSTVLASYGQLISLQNLGTVATYGSHQQVGLYAIAALLVGGASVREASVKHAILGIVLFHTLFILAPNAGTALFGNAQIGEYFRVFVAYGVIALALAMHAWNRSSADKKSAKARKAETAKQPA